MPACQYRLAVRLLISVSAPCRIHHREDLFGLVQLLVCNHGRSVPAVESCAMTDILQRCAWNGSPTELGELFIVTKNNRTARCVLLNHQFGWEVRLFVGHQVEIVQSQVCRTQDEVLATGEQWKAAMSEKGWIA